MQYLSKLGMCIFKKIFICRAKIVFAAVVCIQRFTVSAAAVAAKHKPTAVFAVIGQRL